MQLVQLLRLINFTGKWKFSWFKSNSVCYRRKCLYWNRISQQFFELNIGDTIILSPTTNYNCEQTSIVDEIPLGGGGSSNEYWYNTWADAEADINNIEEGGKVYTNDDPDDVINARNVKYDDGTQAGSDVETQINNIKSDFPYKRATANSGVTVQNQILTIKTTFDALSYDEKSRATIRFNNRVYHCDNTSDGRFISTEIDNSTQKLTTLQILIASARYTLVSGTTWSDSSSATSSSNMELYA